MFGQIGVILAITNKIHQTHGPTRQTGPTIQRPKIENHENPNGTMEKHENQGKIKKTNEKSRKTTTKNMKKNEKQWETMKNLYMADADADADAVTPSSNTRSYTLRSVPSSPGR